MNIAKVARRKLRQLEIANQLSGTISADTSLDAPEDFRKLEEAPAVDDPVLPVAPRSVVLLMAG